MKSHLLTSSSLLMTSIPLPPENTAPTDALSPQLGFVLQLVRTQSLVIRRVDQALAGYHGISFNDFLLLHHLSQGPGGRLRRVDLAQRHGLTASGITRTLLPLEKLYLVERQHEPRDARVTYAAITTSGTELLRNALVSAEQVSNELLASAAPEELETLRLALASIARIAITHS
jgi:DNA-binding MarR family transcriptional regulator